MFFATIRMTIITLSLVFLGSIPGQAQSANDIQIAMAADHAGDYATAMRIYRQLDASEGLVIANRNFAFSVVEARIQIGKHYESGVGVPQKNYSLAAQSYEKALATRTAQGDDTLGGLQAARRLAFLLASGTGVARDVDRAHQLLQGSGPSARPLLRLLQYDLLPRTFDELTSEHSAQAFSCIDAYEANEISDDKQVRRFRKEVGVRPGGITECMRRR